MPKKESKISIKSIINQFMQQSLQSLISVVAEQSEHIVDWIRDISGFKRKIRNIMIAVAFSAAGLGVLGVGISQYLVSLNSSLGNGLSYILVGGVFILIGIIFTKIR